MKSYGLDQEEAPAHELNYQSEDQDIDSTNQSLAEAEKEHHRKFGETSKSLATMIKQQTSDMPSVIAKGGKSRAFNNADLIGVTINGVGEY